MKPSMTLDARPLDLPVGPRLVRALDLAYRASRAVLLEGPTGIGKSEIVRAAAKKLGIELVVLDLSLLEPPDLVGLPIIEHGRTRYALPGILPTEGRGILLLEELNRAERYIQQPALQLLSARTLHDYVLPPGWVPFAAINPETGDYQVTTLDPALRARFLQLRVRADRPSFLAWAIGERLHPAVIAIAQKHDRVLDDVCPRTWAYVSEVLAATTPDERNDAVLMRDVLNGYLPGAWIETLLALPELTSPGLDVDVHALLRAYDASSSERAMLLGYKERGETDKLDEVVHRLCGIVKGPEAGVLIAERSFSLEAFEALLLDLPGDQAEKLQDALGSNPTAVTLLGIDPKSVLAGYAASPIRKEIELWKRDRKKHHRVALLVTAVANDLKSQKRSLEVKKSNALRESLGHLLAQLGAEHGMPLVDALQRVGITPIRPD
jgi:MoxR-like ATPase